MDNDKINLIIIRINKLAKKEKIHILNILKKYQPNFSKNFNGYFFNLGLLDKSVIDKIENCLDVIENNRDLIIEMDTKRNDMLIFYKTLIEEKIQLYINNNITLYTNLLTIKPISNVFYNFKKITKDVKKVVDYDILLKEYKKSCKYNKNSVYYSILSKMKSAKTPNRKINESRQDQENTDFDTEFNEDLEEEIMDEPVDVDVDVDLDLDLEENDLEIFEKNTKKFLQKLENNIHIDIESEDENEVEIIEEQLEDEVDAENNKIEFSKTLIQYKKILSSHNFIFDEDSCCLLEFEEYIH